MSEALLKNIYSLIDEYIQLSDNAVCLDIYTKDDFKATENNITDDQWKDMCSMISNWSTLDCEDYQYIIDNTKPQKDEESESESSEIEPILFEESDDSDEVFVESSESE